MISINNLSMVYGARLLFEGVSMNLLPGKRYGLVGANGCGKSTLMRLLSNEEEPSWGEISIPKHLRVGCLKQDQFLYEDDTVVNAVIRGRPELWQALEEKEELLTHEDWSEEMGFRLGELEEKIAEFDGYTAEGLAETLLIGLGIDQKYHHGPLKNLSGGYKLRVLLAQALFNRPDILLLDEPTNHLDIMTIAWLEGYLRNTFKGLLIFISHDQDFLNNLSTHILDIDYGEVRLYTGNYNHFVKEKEEIVAQKLSERGYLEDKIAHLRSFVDRFGAKASKAGQAQSRMKMIEKIEIPEIKKSSRVAPHFQFTQKRPSGKLVLKATDISKSFGDKQVLKNVGFTLNRGEKIAIIGHNGVGKSTLLKCILANIPMDQGSVEWGHEVSVSYFSQDHHDLLKERSTLVDWLNEQHPQAPSQEVRGKLGQMLFGQDEAYKSTLSLSGGEAARLLFAHMTLQQGNLLVLDEPTNHLDLETRVALAKALKQFQGTVLFVSHDRHFVSHLATRVIALTEKGLKDYHGSYKEYLKHIGEDYLSRSWLQGK